MLLLLSFAAANAFGADASGEAAGSSNETLGKVAFQQNLGEMVPGGLSFIDHHGQRVTLDDIADGKPVLLLMGYYRCRMLCKMVLENLSDTVQHVPYAAGGDYEIVFISVDPRETHGLASQKLESTVGNDNADGWHLLTGNEEAIKQVAEAIGFGYAYDAKTDQYAHPAGAVVLTPKLKIARYLLGMRFAARDVKFALIDASNGNVGSAVDQVLLRCYSYDPRTGQYGFRVTMALNIAGTVTVIGLATMVSLLSYKHRRQRLTDTDAGDKPSPEPPPAGEGGA